MRPTILLFDIDGTLISTAGAARHAFERAFEVRYGRADACTGISFGGMTDRAIARAALERIEVAASDQEIDAALGAYLELLPVELATTPACRIHAGIEPALDRALASEGFAVGLGTGNVRKGAYIKLARVGLEGRFGFGGFGCDHELRPELIRIGAERGAATLGVARSACRVVVIGDTPRDVDAALAIGAECIAVATGFVSAADLAAAGATRVFRDLAEEGALAALLGEA